MYEGGQLSASKTRDLIRLKKIVDRFAQCPYIGLAQIRELKKRYGACPSILSWGDYFQVEIASSCFQLSDKAFSKAVDTVYFDLIAAVKIFQAKPDHFLEDVRAEGLAVYGKAQKDWDAQEEQSAHLSILLRYYEELQLAQMKLQTADKQWFQDFLPVQAYAGS